MTSEGLGEVFKGDSAHMCAGKFPLVLMGGRANGQACTDGERGPPSARAEIFFFFLPPLFKPTEGVVVGFQNLRYDFGGVGEGV